MAASSVATQSPFDRSRSGWFFVVGISPGLSAVGYCVLDVDAAGRAHCLTYDVLTGNRAAQLERAGIDISIANVVQLATRFRIHSRILNVVLERYYPCVVAIGPAAINKEPPKFVEAAVSALHETALLFGLKVVTVSEAELHDRYPKERLPTLVQSRIETPIRDRRVLRAAAAGLAAAESVRPIALLDR